MGFEPTTFGTTIRRSNLLSYNLRFGTAKIENFLSTTKLFLNNFFRRNHLPESRGITGQRERISRPILESYILQNALSY